MGRIAGVPNKITSEVKEKLQLLIDDLIASLDLNDFIYISYIIDKRLVLA